jgi:hypothetical protein
LTNDARLTKADKEALARLESPLVHVRGSKGWMTATLMCGVLTRLARASRNAAPGRPVVVFMDCAPAHIARVVLAHAQRLRVVVVLAPANMTWLLQPLDSHVFQPFKAAVARAQTRERGESPKGALPPGRWVDVAAAAARDVICGRDWARAMVANGLTGPGHALRNRVSEALGHGLPLPLRPPTAEEFAAIFGRPAPATLESLLRLPRRLLAEAAPASLRPTRPVEPHAASASGERRPVGRLLLPAPAPAPARRTRSGTFY